MTFHDEITLEGFVREMKAASRATLLVRHGERPKMDPDDPSFGDALALTPEGVRTATLLGAQLKEFADDVSFYASPLTRTRMTAACIAQGMGVPDAPIPTDGRLGNDSFYYADASQVLEIFKPKNFFPACFEYYQTGRQKGFRDLYAATDAWEAWIDAEAKTRLFVVTTHDCYVAAFLAARRGVTDWSCENWVRFLDAAAIFTYPDGRRRYALVRTGLSTGIVGVPVKK